MEEESYNVDLKEEAQKVESLSEDNKEVVVEVSSAYGNETQEQDYESLITDDVHKEHVSESVVGSTIEPVENTTLASDNTVELELKEEKEEDSSVSHEPEETHLVKGLEKTELPPSEDNNQFSSIPENEDSRKPEVVETDDKDVKIDEEEKNVLSSDVVTDVASEETLETSIIAKLDEGENKVPPITPEQIPKEIEKSLEPSKDEKLVGDVQDPSYESAKDYESSQPLPKVSEAENTSVTLPKETEVPRSIENQNNAPETQRERGSWSSCCGIFEILMGGR